MGTDRETAHSNILSFDHYVVLFLSPPTDQNLSNAPSCFRGSDCSQAHVPGGGNLGTCGKGKPQKAKKSLGGI